MEYSCTRWLGLVSAEGDEAGSGAGTSANTGVVLCRGLRDVIGSSGQGSGSMMLQEAAVCCDYCN